MLEYFCQDANKSFDSNKSKPNSLSMCYKNKTAGH